MTALFIGTIQAVWAIAYEERHVEALRKIYLSTISEPVSGLEFWQFKGFSYYCKTSLWGVSENGGITSHSFAIMLFLQLVLYKEKLMDLW